MEQRIPADLKHHLSGPVTKVGVTFTDIYESSDTDEDSVTPGLRFVRGALFLYENSIGAFGEDLGREARDYLVDGTGGEVGRNAFDQCIAESREQLRHHKNIAIEEDNAPAQLTDGIDDGQPVDRTGDQVLRRIVSVRHALSAAALLRLDYHLNRPNQPK